MCTINGMTFRGPLCMCYYGDRIIEFLQNFVMGKFLGKVNI